MKDLELTARIAASAQQIADAKGVSQRHHVDTLVGVISRNLLAGKTECQALDAARAAAADMVRTETSNSVVDQLLALVNQADAMLLARQSL